jgi:trk system potassium uptake protein TrkH
MLMTFVGGCAGSTSGGIKVLRWVLVGKQASREIKRLVHPSGEFAVKLPRQSPCHRVSSTRCGVISRSTSCCSAC